jgi:hypothetical protein
MRLAACACLGLLTAAPAPGLDRLIDFQQYRFGLTPTEFDYDATGPHGPVLAAGRPLWRTYVDLFAPSPKLVLIQSSALAHADHYPIALLREVNAENLKLAVSFKLLDGQVARSAGVLWRARDKDHYCTILVDGLHHEVHLLLMKGTRPAELAKATAVFDEKEWDSLEISAQGDHVLVWLNDRLVLDAREPALRGAGRVGLVTHADTIAVFDDFYIQSGEGRVVRKPRPAPGPNDHPTDRNERLRGPTFPQDSSAR